MRLDARFAMVATAGALATLLAGSPAYAQFLDEFDGPSTEGWTWSS